MLTFGTGIGSAILYGGRLIPDFEFGQMPTDGRPTEFFASIEAMRRNKLTFADWAVHVNEFLAAVETTANPDLIVFGGGISEDTDRWWHLLHTRARRDVARLRNDAGIVGAVMNAVDKHSAFV